MGMSEGVSIVVQVECLKYTYVSHKTEIWSIHRLLCANHGTALWAGNPRTVCCLHNPLIVHILI